MTHKTKIIGVTVAVCLALTILLPVDTPRPAPKTAGHPHGSSFHTTQSIDTWECGVCNAEWGLLRVQQGSLKIYDPRAPDVLACPFCPPGATVDPALVTEYEDALLDMLITAYQDGPWLDLFPGVQAKWTALKSGIQGDK
jgi:hypothetical protein